MSTVPDRCHLTHSSEIPTETYSDQPYIGLDLDGQVLGPRVYGCPLLTSEAIADYSSSATQQ